jgi:predicted nucleic acid-binding Zn ribbon protein
MGTLYNKECLHCKQNFSVIAKRKKQKFCSPVCSTTYRRKYEYHTHCVNCGISLDKDQKKFCCQSCSAIYTNKIRDKTSRRKQRESLLKTLKITGKARTREKETYKRNCAFKKWTDYDLLKIKGNELLAEYKMYCPNKNIIVGVVLDHMYSISDGYKNKIDPNIIAHPANCEIMLNEKNCKKGSKSSISYQELLDRIKSW